MQHAVCLLCSRGGVTSLAAAKASLTGAKASLIGANASLTGAKASLTGAKASLTAARASLIGANAGSTQQHCHYTLTLSSPHTQPWVPLQPTYSSSSMAKQTLRTTEGHSLAWPPVEMPQLIKTLLMPVSKERSSECVFKGNWAMD